MRPSPVPPFPPMNRSPNSCRAALALFILFTGGTAAAEPEMDLIAYEPFDYPPDKKPLESHFFASGQGWRAESWEWTQTKEARYAVPDGLTYPGLQTAGGASRQEGAKTAQYRRFFLVPAPETAVRYLSFLIRVDPLNGPNYTGGLQIGGDLLDGCFVRIGAAAGMPAVIDLQNGRGGVLLPTGFSPQTGQTHLLVVKCETTPGHDRFSFFADPVPGEPEPAVPVKVKTDTDAGRLNRIIMTADMHHTLDEIRFGKTWASVTPKISTAAAGEIPVLADNFMARGDALSASLAGHGGGCGPWTTPWVSHRRMDAFGLDLTDSPGGAVVSSPVTRLGITVARSFAPPLPDAGEAWLSFSLLASGSNAPPGMLVLRSGAVSRCSRLNMSGSLQGCIQMLKLALTPAQGRKCGASTTSCASKPPPHCLTKKNSGGRVWRTRIFPPPSGALPW